MLMPLARSSVGVFLLVAGAASTTAGCKAQGSEAAKTPIGVSDIGEQPEIELQSEAKEAETISQSVLEDAARPFFGYRWADALELKNEELLTYLASADAICIGERHDNVMDHYGQLRTIEGFLERRAMRGFHLGLALEMVRLDGQSALTAFEAGKIDGDTFREYSAWKSEWGFPIEYYLPQLQAAKDGGGALIALGISRDLTDSIAQKGVDSLTPEERRKLPEIDRSSEEHRELFEKLMEGHPGTEEKMDSYYEVQLLWDEAMAARSAEWLGARVPGRKLIILAGTAHCHRSAIPARLARRTHLKVVNLLMVEGGKAQTASGEGSSVDDLMAAGYDYQMVFQR